MELPSASCSSRRTSWPRVPWLHPRASSEELGSRRLPPKYIVVYLRHGAPTAHIAKMRALAFVACKADLMQGWSNNEA